MGATTGGWRCYRGSPNSDGPSDGAGRFGRWVVAVRAGEAAVSATVYVVQSHGTCDVLIKKMQDLVLGQGQGCNTSRTPRARCSSAIDLRVNGDVFGFGR